ncbi:MAG: hypothetical protein ACE5Q6_00290 [Dehalococcoidia bacterium]
MSQIDEIIRKIHDTPHKTVMVVAGAGTQAMAWLLGISGASRTILETRVPYGRFSMIDFLGKEPEQYVSTETARDMAKAAYQRGRQLLEDASPVIGMACTATIATDRPKRGDHRACIAFWDEQQVARYDLILDKGLRDRVGEEEVVSRLLLQGLAQACGIEDELPTGLGEGDRLQVSADRHPSPVQRLLSGDADTVTVHPDGRMAVDEPVEAALLPGSFNPLHHGHEQLAAQAARVLGTEVAFELSVVNVDKPPLAESEILGRAAQFAGKRSVVLTRAETFRKKTEFFPGNQFVIGWDTAVRLIDPVYYGGEKEAMLTALAEMWAKGTRFLVAGREQEGTFHTLADVAVPAGFAPLFQALPESQFRADVSSTDLRAELEG